MTIQREDVNNTTVGFVLYGFIYSDKHHMSSSGHNSNRIEKLFVYYYCTKVFLNEGPMGQTSRACDFCFLCHSTLDPKN